MCYPLKIKTIIIIIIIIINIIIIIIYKFEASSCNAFWDIKFSKSKFAKSNSSKKKNDFFYIFTR